MSHSHPPPIWFILIFCLCAAVVATVHFFAPSFDEDEGPAVIFYAWLIAGLIFSVLLVCSFFPERTCTLFYHLFDKPLYDRDGNFWKDESQIEWCKKHAVGKVRVRIDKKETFYFCKDHDPEIRWMQEWLRKNHIVVLRTKRFSWVDTDG